MPRTETTYTVPNLTDYSDESLLRAVVEFRESLFLEAFEVQEKTIDPALSSTVRLRSFG